MKVGRVAIVTRGRYAGKKVRQQFSPARVSRDMDEWNWMVAKMLYWRMDKEEEKKRTDISEGLDMNKC